jgi:serine protease Do
LPDTVQGVVVAQVNPSSDAAEQGIQRGDIIVSLNQQPVRTPQEAATAVANARKAGRDTVLLFVQRGNTPGRFIGVKIQ